MARASRFLTVVGLLAVFGACAFEQQMTPQDREALQGAMALGMGLVALIVAFLAIAFVIQIIFCLLVYNCYKAIPEEHREMSAGLVWLLLIPLFGLVWNFFVYPNLSKSFKRYFDSVGDASAGNCNLTLAWVYAGVTAATVVPYLNGLAGPASLVLFIVYVAKAYGLKARIAPPSA